MEGGKHQVEKPTWMSRIRFLSPTAVTCRTLRVKFFLSTWNVGIHLSFFFPFFLSFQLTPSLRFFFFPLRSPDIDYFSFELKLNVKLITFNVTLLAFHFGTVLIGKLAETT